MDLSISLKYFFLINTQPKPGKYACYLSITSMTAAAIRNVVFLTMHNGVATPSQGLEELKSSKKSFPLPKTEVFI